MRAILAPPHQNANNVHRTPCDGASARGQFTSPKTTENEPMTLQEIRLHGRAHQHGYDLCKYGNGGGYVLRGSCITAKGDWLECPDIDAVEQCVAGLGKRVQERFEAMVAGRRSGATAP
jgi:hypothetical protein